LEPVITFPMETRPRRDPHVAARLAGPPSTRGESRAWRLLTGEGGGAAVGCGIGSEEALLVLPLLCPHQPELIAANLLWKQSDGLRQRGNGSAAAVRCLAELRVEGPAGPVAHLALVVALSSSKADMRVAAAEAWTRWAADGRLDAGHAAEAIRLGGTGPVFPLNRIAEALGYAIPDPAAAAVTARCCVTATAALLDDKPTGLHLLLEVAARAAAVSAVPMLPAPVAALAASTATSKLAQAARRLSRLATLSLADGSRGRVDLDGGPGRADPDGHDVDGAVG
jgi:hypothetical protein